MRLIGKAGRKTLESGTPLQLIDVRRRAEWLKGHLPGAISLPLQDPNPDTDPLDLELTFKIWCFLEKFMIEFGTGLRKLQWKGQRLIKRGEYFPK